MARPARVDRHHRTLAVSPYCPRAGLWPNRWWGWPHNRPTTTGRWSPVKVRATRSETRRLSAIGLRRARNRIPGRDVAGTVAAVGSAVTRFAVGDEVFGIAPGSFAEYAVAPERKLAHKPEVLSFEQAAVVPISALTALQGLVDVGRVEPGQNVLVTGASGGVGSYVVQLAKAFGARVTAVASTTKQDLVRSLGADHVIDYTRQDFGDAATTSTRRRPSSIANPASVSTDR